MRSSSRALLLFVGASLAGLGAAVAQAPTAAQQQAIRSNCVSDYRAHCATVPTGGMAALVCLEQNVDSLSPACKSAVEAVEPAQSTASSKPAPAATETAAKASSDSQPEESASTTTAAASDKTTESSDESQGPAPASAAAKAPTNEPKLTFRQEMAIAAGSCAVDFRLFCPDLPVGHGNVLFCLQVHGPKLAPACRSALVKLGVNL